MKKITFYFDPISPYSYFASIKMKAFIEKTKSEVCPVPILFAALLDHWKQEGPAEIPFLRAYVWKDVLRLAAFYGRKIQGPPAHPFNPLPALRLCEVVKNPKERLALATHIMKTAWEEGKDISDLNILESIIDQLGWKSRNLMSQIHQPDIKEGLKKNTEEAIRQGVFGVPTFLVDGELFWGQDRMDVLEQYLLGKLTVDEKLYQNFLSRPRDIDRIQK